MRKETKALLQKNNQQETLLFPDFQSVLNNMVTYLRSTRLPYSLQEQARQQIIQLFLAEQEKGASPDEVIGMDFKEYCDTLLEQSPRNNGHTRILCAVRYISMFLAVGTAILFLPDMISAPFTPNHSFTLQVGKLIFLFFLVTFGYFLLKNAGKNAFVPAEKLLGIACAFFLKKPAWEIPFWVPLAAVVLLFLCYGLLSHYLD